MPVEMPPVYVAEMLCDRIAACKVYQGRNYTDASPYDYFMRSKERAVIHPATKELLMKLLIMLKDEGEDAVFAYVRREMLGKRR